MQKIWPVTVGVFLLVVFWTSGARYLDPDFGWHVGAGRWIWENKKVPLSDPFSFTRPDYPWSDHEWLTNTGLYWASEREKLDYLWLAFGFGIVAVLAVIVGMQGKWVIGVLGAMVILPYAGVRPQVISWLFLAVELVLIRAWLRRRTAPVFLLDYWPLLFLVGWLVGWSNLHGGSVLGIAVLGFAGVVEVVAGWKAKKSLAGTGLVFAMIVSLAAIQIFNPYGLAVYREVGLIARDWKLTWTIAEWMPMGRMDMAFLSYTGLALALVWQFGYVLRWWERIGVWGMWILGMWANRHIPLFVVFSLPIVAQCGDVFLRELILRKVKLTRKMMGGLMVVVVAVTANQIRYALKLMSPLSEDKYYPAGAVSFLQEKTEQRVFNYYGWGGYLVWKLPGRKWFIDGRMPSWDGIISEYSKIAGGKDGALALFSKYNVEIVVWPRAHNEGGVEFEGKGMLALLAKEGWRVVYEDQVAQVWENED